MAAADREKSLDAALAQIDRQFGKGSVMRLGDEVRVPIEVIPTGSIALDIALGIGGLPRGRVVEIYGPESSGKCLTADALVPTNWGLLTVGEIFERCGEKASCTSRVSDIAHVGLKVVNEHGELEPVAALTHNNRRPVLRIETSTGKSVRVTANHPMRVLNERGFVVWRSAGDVSVGDTLVGVLGADADAKDQIDEREALLLGYLVGDGHYSAPYAVMFSQVDEQVSTEFNELMADLAPDVVPSTYAGRPGDTWFRGKALRDSLTERYGLEPVKAPEKVVPLVVRASGAAVQRAFLSALFECDGCVEDDTVTLTTASRQLAREVQCMLAGLGLVSSVRAKSVPSYPDNVYWTVALGNASSARFVDEVGFRSDRRAVQTAGMRRGVRDAARHIPHLRDVARDLRDSVGGDREFDKIAGDLFRDFGPGHDELAATPERIVRLVRWAEERGVGDHALVTHLRQLRLARRRTSGSSRSRRAVMSRRSTSSCRAPTASWPTASPSTTPQWRCTPWRRRRSWAASRRSSTRSTRSTPTTPQKLGVDPTHSWSRSRTPASRRWRSPTCSPERRDRHHRHRLGRGPRPARGDRGRDGGFARRAAGPPDEPGAAQDHRRAQQHEHDRDLHQPAPREDRGHVRLTRRPRRVGGR